MNTHYQDLCQLVSADSVSIAKEVLDEHSIDRWYASGMPEVVVFAQSTEDVVAVMRYANEREIPVYTRGAGGGMWVAVFQ